MTLRQGLSWWLDQIGRIHLLSPAQEIELGTLIQRWRQHPEPCPPGIRRAGQRAREQFIRANLRLVMLVLRKHAPRQADQEDLIQEGTIGLCRAVDLFDPTRGYRFSTYAYLWIRQAISRYANRYGRAIAIPGAHAAHLARLGPVGRALEQQLGRSPTRPELAEAMGISVATLELVIANGQAIASLDEIVGDDGQQLGAGLPSWDQTPEEQEEQQQRWQQAEQLRGLIAQLPRADQRLLSLAWGLDGEQLERRELARQEGISLRKLERRLEGLEAQLRGRSIQLVIVAVARVPVPPRPGRRARRQRVQDAEQLVLVWL